MHPERLRRLLGDDLDLTGYDLTAEDDVAALVDVAAPRQSPAFAAALTVAIRQVLEDEPPETWQAVERTLARGLSAEEAVRQLSAVVLGELSRMLGEREPFDRDRYAAALALLPLPSSDQVAAALEDVPGLSQGVPLGEVLVALAARFAPPGAGDLEQLRGWIEARVEEVLGSRFVLLHPDRLVDLRALASGSTFTVRVDETIARHGDLVAELDLVPLDDGWSDFVDGAPGPLDRPLPVPPGAEVGDLLAVTIQAEGARVEKVAEPPSGADPELVAVFVASLDAETDVTPLPISLAELVARVLLSRPDAFAEPRLPLTELVDAAGLDRRGGLVAAGPWGWHAEARSARAHAAVALLDDPDDVDAAMAAMDVADVLGGVDPEWVGRDVSIDRTALRDVLDDLRRPEILGVVVEQMLADDESAARLAALGEALLGVASGGEREGIAQLVLATGLERADAVAAEGHLRRAHAALPDSGPAIDRLAWFASDRGDASRAAALWEQLEPTASVLGDLDAIAPYAAAAAPPARGRNDRCWCGSGKKYKHCHLGKPAVLPLTVRVPWLCFKATSFVHRRHGAERDEMMALVIARAADPDDEQELEAAFSDPLVVDLLLHEEGWFERFLAERGPLLPGDELALARTWVEAPRRLVEVVGVDDGNWTIELRDLATGDELEVVDPEIVDEAEPGSRWLVRPVPDGMGLQVIGGWEPVDPAVTPAVLDALAEASSIELLLVLDPAAAAAVT